VSAYIARRFLIMIPTLLVISVISFALIQLPPGDYLTSYIVTLEQQGDQIDQATINGLRQRYGLDKPIVDQYILWMSGIFRGDFGYSFTLRMPVGDVIWERLGLTLAVTLSSLLFSWVVAFPIGFYSAVNKNSFGDYFFTFIGFIGLSIPNFLLALILMYLSFRYLGASVGGLFSEQYVDAPWSIAKFLDMLSHLWLPMIIVGTAGTAGLIRVLRNNLLDELQKPYVAAARARGLSEFRLLLKYPVRVAINPFLSTVGWILPGLISGATIVSVVLSLPTSGPVLLQALLNQDMYLGGTFTMLLAVLTVLGTLISDILLALVDPRVRLG
jgi:peptide/nickel transport system permease protein